MRRLPVIIVIAAGLCGCRSDAEPPYERAYHALHRGVSQADAEHIMKPYATDVRSMQNSSWGRAPDTIIFALPDNKQCSIDVRDQQVVRVSRLESRED